jgi:ABC-2 type transport system ATP-binding protein
VFREQVHRIRSDGGTVLLSSHILSEVEHLCDRVTIIRRGVTVETGTLESMRAVTRASFRVAGLPGEADLAALPGVHVLSRVGDRAEFEVDGEATAAVLMALGRWNVSGVTITPPSLESLFLRHYGDAVVGGVA